MSRFFPRAQTTHPGQDATQTVFGSGLLARLDPAMLSVVQQPGSYAGRRVTHCRVFDSTRGRAGDEGIIFRTRTP